MNRRTAVALIAVAVFGGAAIGAATISHSATPEARPSKLCDKRPTRPRCNTTTSGTVAPTTTTPGPVLPYRAPGNTDTLPSTLKMRDEFTATTLDPTVWSTGWLASGVTQPVQQQELTCYAPEQVTVSDGSLHLKAIAKAQSCGGKTRPYTSGMVNSSGKREFTYGYFEARLWIDASGSKCANWGAWWANGHKWPDTGEYDFMECLSGGNSSNWHGPGGAGNVGRGGARLGWHIFAGYWKPGVVTTYYDGVKLGTYSSASNVTGAPMYLILGEQIGPENQYGGPVKIPSELTVDYVRVWQ